MSRANPPERRPLAIGAVPSPGLAWLVWCINRLRCMSPAEVGHHLLRRAASQAERLGLPGPAAVPPADLTHLPPSWIAVPSGIEAAPYLTVADRLLAGHFDIFTLRDVDLGSPPPWNRDPRTGTEAPLTFGKLLDYRDPKRVGDIKYLWELNRHLHLPTLAQAWALSADDKYARALAGHLDDWFAHCPPGRGANWSSALEAGLRLINWAAAWQLLGGADALLFRDAWGHAFRQRWLTSVHQHAHFIRSYFSHYSSANNHLIGEAAGLFIATLTWPHWPWTDTWRTEAQAVLEREIRLQNALDGVNREQATAYQRFEIELLLLAWHVADANGLAFSADYRRIVERMFEFLVSIMDAGGHAPQFGDADDSVVLRLDPTDSQEGHLPSLLALGTLRFERGDFKVRTTSLGQARWLFGDAAAARYATLAPAIQPSRPIRQAFPHGGYYILGCDFAGPDEIFLVADAGDLGYQRIAAHGHADALSFTLSLGGREFLIDSGTYAYHAHDRWRQYFRGTSAHNTARVDGEDQSTPGGNFMWLHKAKAYCSHWHSSPREDVFEGWHDGYRRLADPVIHQRRLTLDKAARRITIDDRFRMRGEHRIELFFHCSEHCRVEPRPGGYLLRQGDRELLLDLPPGGSHTLHRGSLAPLLGWVSRHYDEKQPTTTIAYSIRLSGNTSLRSGIQC